MEPTRTPTSDRPQGASDMVERMKKVKEETEAALNAAARDMKRYYDARHRPPEFKVGDEVWLDAEDLSTERPSKKLDYKRLGPFPIIQKIDDLAFKLKLPTAFKIHPVISASRLEPVKRDEWSRPQPRVTLKVRDPQTGEIINRMESSSSVFRVSENDIVKIGFQPIEK
jgi:hypothetical protein